MSRIGCPNKEAPAWLDAFPRPLCFVDPRDWRAYIEAYRAAAFGAAAKALQRGIAPPHCADCAGGEYRAQAERAGNCHPVCDPETDFDEEPSA